MRKQKPTAKLPKPKFNFMAQEWRRVRFAVLKDGYTQIGASIQKYIEGYRPTDFVEISVPVDCCLNIARACANHGVGKGIAFATAASGHYVEKREEKPVDAETVERVREELEGMET